MLLQLFELHVQFKTLQDLFTNFNCDVIMLLSFKPVNVDL